METLKPKPESCYWCGELAVKEIDLDFESDSTGYRETKIHICDHPECVMRTKRVLKIRGLE